MSMITKQGNNYVLIAGANESSIDARITGFAKKLSEQWVDLTDLAATVFVHYVSQKQVAEDGHKGDTTLIMKLSLALHEQNSSMRVAFNKAAAAIVGLKLSYDDVLAADGKTVEGLKAKTELSDKGRKAVLSDFEKLLTEMISSGIKGKYGPAVKSTKAKRASSSAAPANAGAEEKTFLDVALDTGGMREALTELGNNSEAYAQYKANADLLVEMLGLFGKVNSHRLHEQLSSAVTKLKGQITVPPAKVA